MILCVDIIIPQERIRIKCSLWIFIEIGVNQIVFGKFVTSLKPFTDTMKGNENQKLSW